MASRAEFTWYDSCGDFEERHGREIYFIVGRIEDIHHETICWYH
jgi:hypothetical protein